MSQQVASTDEPFKTKKAYVASRSAFSMAGLNWLIFNKREELEEAGAIIYLGSKVLITPRLDDYILAGGTKTIGGLNR
jgi:hypothetical protein